MAANKVSGSGYNKLKQVFGKLRKDLPKQLMALGNEMAEEAAVRAPTPEQEYQTMMTGDGNPEGITNIPPMPDSSAGSDGDHRLRFYKPTGFYLQPVIKKNFAMTAPLTVSLGNETELNVSSQYTWRNVNGEEFTSTFPFWEAWENGMQGSFVIAPRRIGGGTRQATLKPGLGKENRRYFMYKSIPRLKMYGSIDVDAHIDTNLIPAIRKLVREA